MEFILFQGETLKIRNIFEGSYELNRNRTGSRLNNKFQKLVDQLIYLGSNISSPKSYVNIHITDKWTTTEIVNDHVKIWFLW